MTLMEVCDLCGCVGTHYCTGKPMPPTEYSSGTKKLTCEDVGCDCVSELKDFKEGDIIEVAHQTVASYPTESQLTWYKREFVIYRNGLYYCQDPDNLSRLEPYHYARKPKEDSEIEKLAEELRIESNSYRDYHGKDYWPRIARKAIEIIRGEK